jgi:hypothetical protein
MLRGPQTLGELKQRSDRLHGFASLAEVQQTLDGLSDRELAARLPRRPGQKEERYAQLLGAEEAPEIPVTPGSAADPLERLEQRVRRLEEDLAALQRELGKAPEPTS